MRHKERNSDENYLERIPQRAQQYKYVSDEQGIVTIEIENKGFFNKMAQKIFKKPKISYIHLDEMGSFIWLSMDGEKNLLEIAEKVEEKYGEDAQPLYERLAKYMQILHSYGFLQWVR